MHITCPTGSHVLTEEEEVSKHPQELLKSILQHNQNSPLSISMIRKFQKATFSTKLQINTQLLFGASAVMGFTLVIWDYIWFCFTKHTTIKKVDSVVGFSEDTEMDKLDVKKARGMFFLF